MSTRNKQYGTNIKIFITECDSFKMYIVLRPIETWRIVLNMFRSICFKVQETIFTDRYEIFFRSNQLVVVITSFFIVFHCFLCFLLLLFMFFIFVFFFFIDFLFLSLSQLSRGKFGCHCLFRQPIGIFLLMLQIERLRLKLQRQRRNYSLVVTSCLRISRNSASISRNSAIVF